MTRTALKTSFACWIGIFLILPGCLCQLLACIGIDLHEDQRFENAIVAPSFASSLDCHCDEDSGKVAEITPSTIDSQHDAVWLETVTDQPAVPSAAPIFASKNARAPPSVAQPPSAPQFCALISVWLV